MAVDHLKLCIHQFSFFSGLLILRGIATNVERSIASIHLDIGGHECRTLYNHPEPGQFFFHEPVPFNQHSLIDPVLVVGYADGGATRVADPGTLDLGEERGHKLLTNFLHRLAAQPAGAMLEIGSRARSGISRRSCVPPTWNYVGFDIMAGDNVDIVGDAHSMATVLAGRTFDAIMSFSVFEHLAMPWKVVVEANKLLKLGGIAFVQTHQSFPLHDMPWDFWRFSLSAWAALFNVATGFRIIEAASAEPVFMVAERWHRIVNYGQSRGYAVSSVMVEKIAETSLSWDVDVADIVVGNYPH